MSTVFDTHAFIKRLTAAGMPEAQAEIIAEQQAKLVDALVTRQHFDQQLQTLATKVDLAELKAEVLKWMTGMLLAQAALIAALVKLL
jgi:hypothetical protein